MVKKPIREPGLTQEMIDASVVKTLDALDPDLPRVTELVTKEAPELMQLIAPAKDKYHRMIQIVNELGAIVGPHVPCKKGCGHCCKMAVGMNSLEADIIGKHIGVVPRPHKTKVHELQGLAAKYVGTACPFLENGKCSIYEVRPIACRTNFNLSAYPSVCNVVDYQGQTLPNLNFWPLWKAQTFIGSSYEHGDIRDFFPDGKDTTQKI